MRSARRPGWALGAALALAVLAGCAVCDRSTCLGCCDPSGECFDGTARATCGARGSVCVQCSFGFSCVDGACVRLDPPDAGPSDAGPVCSCTAGCCLPDGTCSAGNLPEACGGPREFCVACNPGRCEANKCVTTPCLGCLDAVGTCRPGNQASACGSLGGLCVGCFAGDTCQQGRCVATGCATTCSGCCTSTNSCVANPNNSQCGSAGARCIICPSGKNCVGGSCV